MIQSWHMPTRKTEQAFKRLFAPMLADNLQGVQMLTRFSGTKIAEPRLSIVCADARNLTGDGQLSGCWEVDVTLAYTSHYERDGDGEAHDVAAGFVLDVLMSRETTNDSAVPRLLNEASEGEAFEALHWTPDAITEAQEEHSYTTKLTGKLGMVPNTATTEGV